MPQLSGPLAVLAGTATVTASEPTAPAATGLVKVHTMVPAVPTAGVVHVAPAGGVIDTNVVPGGVVKSITTLVSAQTPATHDPALAQALVALHATAGDSLS